MALVQSRTRFSRSRRPRRWSRARWIMPAALVEPRAAHLRDQTVLCQLPLPVATSLRNHRMARSASTGPTSAEMVDLARLARPERQAWLHAEKHLFAGHGTHAVVDRQRSSPRTACPRRISLACTHPPVMQEDFSQHLAVKQDFGMVPGQGFQRRDSAIAHRPSLSETARSDQDLGHVRLAGRQSVLIVREGGVLVEERPSDRLFQDIKIEGVVQPADLCEEESIADERLRKC